MSTPVFDSGPAQRPRPFNFLGCLSLIISLIALVFAFLAWLGVAPPEALQKPIREAQQTESASAVGEAVNTNEQQFISRIHSIFVEVQEEINDPEKKQAVLDKLKQTRESISEWSESTKPKLQESYETLSEQTKSAMEAIQEGAQDAREKVSDLVDRVNQIEEEREKEQE